MTYERAKEILLDAEFTDYAPSVSEAVEIAIKALEKAKEYRWHSLSVDENDLPDMGVGVETVMINKNGETFYDHNWTIPGGEWAKVGNAAHVIKWRYIEN